MRLIALNLMAIMMLAVAPAPATAQTTKPANDVLRVTCFNIRYMNEKDGENRWSARRDIFFDALMREDPDLIGLQEVLHAQGEEIRVKLVAHDYVGVGRNDGKQAGEYVPVLFRRDWFTQRGEGHLWLSETPDVVGSKGWDADLPRMATWVKLADKANGGHEFLFVNTHFDHLGRAARLESAKLLRRKVAELAPSLPAILMGDFNTTEDDEPYAALVNPQGDDALKLIDAYRAAHPTRSPDESSFGGFTGIRKGSRIDWILHTSHWQTTAAVIDTAHRDGRYPSDHYPVRAALKWVGGK